MNGQTSVTHVSDRGVFGVRWYAGRGRRLTKFAPCPCRAYVPGLEATGPGVRYCEKHGKSGRRKSSRQVNELFEELERVPVY